MLKSRHIKGYFKIAFLVFAAWLIVSTIVMAVLGGKISLIAYINIPVTFGVFAVFIHFSHKQLTYLRSRINYYSGIVNSIPFPVKVIDDDMKVGFINKNLQNGMNIKEEDMVGTPSSEYDNQAIDNFEKNGNKEYELTTTNFIFAMSTEPLMIKDVQRGYVQITQDITERRKNAIYQDEAVHKLTDCLEKLSKGDLNIKLSVPKSEKHTQKIYSYFCEIEKNFNNAVKSINDVIVQSVSSVDYVFNHFKGIRDTINDFHGGITENFKSANAALEISSKTMESANVGSEHMNSLTSSMGDIGSSSADISKIIKVIDEIAFQTNLLALNAAVEAARAGKHGKGFAVVADEVRNLATRSAKAAKETTSLIEDSVKKIGHGTSLTESTAEAFAGIFDMISKVSSMVTEINNASKKQTGDIEEIDKSLSDTRQLDTLKKKLSYFNVRR